MSKNLVSEYKKLACLDGLEDSYIKRNYKSQWSFIELLNQSDGAGEIPLINVTREGLIEKVQGRLDEINAAFAAAAAKLDEEDAARASWKTSMSKFYAEYSKAWKGTDFEVDGYGSLRQKDGGPKLPVKPSSPRSEESVKQARVTLERDRKAAVVQLEGQLAVLKIGADVAVQMRGVSVEDLLRTPVPTNLSY